MAEEIKKGFKVVYTANAVLESSIVCGKAAVAYALDIWAYPKPRCGPLAVFDTLENALKFMTANWDEVYTCEYIPSTHKALWKGGTRAVEGMRKVGNFPTGTQFADAVKLLERVE